MSPPTFYKIGNLKLALRLKSISFLVKYFAIVNKTHVYDGKLFDEGPHDVPVFHTDRNRLTRCKNRPKFSLKRLWDSFGSPLSRCTK